MSRMSSTFGKNSGLKSSMKGFGDPGTLRNSTSSMRKSTGSLAAALGSASKKNNELEKIETEYIKNLQQQVYFLELEANYLREQAKKATELHPHMTTEAERMLGRLRQMQAEMDGLRIESKRKESSMDLLNSEKERFISRIKSEEGGKPYIKILSPGILISDSHQREKRLLLDEIVQLKKEKDIMERDTSRKDSQILQAREELDKSATALRSAETKIQMLRNQLDNSLDQQKLSQSSLEEKRTELLKLETQLREVEDKYYSSTAMIQDKASQDLRDEVRLLRQKLKETEMSAEQDRYLRNKLSDDSSHLVKENALLNQQVIEFGKQLEREKNLRESNDTRRSNDITELVVLRDREKQLNFEVDNIREQYRQEQNRTKHYLEEMGKQEQLNKSLSLNSSTANSKLVEIESHHHSTESENSSLRRDKMLLVDHVAELQKQMDEKEKDLLSLRAHVHGLESKTRDLEHLKTLESTLQSQKWDEFSRLAESMKSLSHRMAHSPSPRGTLDGY